ncbi:transcriptional regulator FurA [Flexivirga endophytica]|uniref:Transcriptional regulator FurA n=1 Tax=Flexivirga endophytica TaxID=1849103 RepID=A0A916TGP1_9MICO|nr:Fur family transcriptional regulator [Flexivirga endophytica]GGB43279.1 transcriptional regulator FurA [Flexivirga endophytica]GHB64712.1 transcriptional regulator FurA [Flexivirga endophytica]
MPDFETTLREAGLRVTRPRIAVLESVRDHPHADSALLAETVHDALPSVSRQAIFDCLNTFTETGLVRRIRPSGSPARYELRRNDNHHHLVCRSCGMVVDVECAVGAAPCLHASDDHGFVIDEAEVIYWGYCPDCVGSQQVSPERA